MKLLIKFPTRERPEKFFSVLDTYVKKAEQLNSTGFLITLDSDDYTMNNENVKNRLENYVKNGIKLAYRYGSSKTKIQAVNTDINSVSNWDVVLLASDDMVPVQDGYDEIIRNDMSTHFPDTDGVLWYNDGGQDRINTLCILGRKYFGRFGYIYHPDYISLWCDNEFTEVSIKLNKVYRSSNIIIEHAHPVYSKTGYDQLYAKNESFNNIDKQTYERRKRLEFQ